MKAWSVAAETTWESIDNLTIQNDNHNHNQINSILYLFETDLNLK